MTEHNTGGVRQSLGAYAAREPTLQLVVFLGSSSRGDAGGRADVEIGYLSDEGFDAATFQELAVSVLGVPKVAMVNLKHAASTAFRAAREGALVYERTPNAFLHYREIAIHNWCELAPVINAAFDRIEAVAPPQPR